MPGRSQCQWTIEMRAHCSDAEREAVTTTIRSIARHAQATLMLLPNAGVIQPQVVCYGDDNFVGHFEIAALDDVLASAIDEASPSPSATVSSELLEAAREMQHHANDKK